MKIKLISLTLLAFIGFSNLNAQVGMGTTDPDDSAALEVVSTDKGFLPPRLTTTQRDNINFPPAGLMIFNTTNNAIEFSNGDHWINLEDASVITAVQKTGSAPTGNGGVGIGTESPNVNAQLDITATDKGFLPPRMTSSERNAIAAPGEGLIIYNTENKCLELWNGTSWKSACDGSFFAGPVSDCVTGFIAQFISANETKVVDVVAAGNTWMDRNLGAMTNARATNDCYAYGNLHQWGRGSDGHEDRTSNDVAGPVTAGSEGSDFIINNGDWLINQDNSRWGDPTDADKGVHDPCPAGYRVPTEPEFTNLLNSFSPQNAGGAYGSPLKLQKAGRRLNTTGNVTAIQQIGVYWSSSLQGDFAKTLYFNNNNTQILLPRRAEGQSVRCIKD